MVVGALWIEFLLHDSHSLKEKRKVVRSLVEKTRHKFHIAVAEVGSNDKWQKIELGICTVGNDRQYIDTCLNNILAFLESLYVAEMVDFRMEILTL